MTRSLITFLYAVVIGGILGGTSIWEESLAKPSPSPSSSSGQGISPNPSAPSSELSPLPRRKGSLPTPSQSDLGASSPAGQNKKPSTRPSELEAPPSEVSANAEETIEPTPLEDILLEEGVISRDQWLRIKAEEEEREAKRPEEDYAIPSRPRWYERLRLRGWAQLRYNQLGNPNGALITWQDKSVGKYLGSNGLDAEEAKGFYLRRVRLILSGQVTDRMGIYFQPDFANSQNNGSSLGVDLKDAWTELYLDPAKEFRFRAGLQKIPCSWEGWQSSSRRVPIDRADVSATCDNRDLGLSLQWTPQWAQHRWKHMVDYLYGAGDYGMVNISVYNGQGGGVQERNGNKHFAARLAYPFELPGGRLLEVGMNAFSGKYSVDMGTPTNNSVQLFSFNTNQSFARTDYTDERVNFNVYYPPQPWGFLAEYSTGRGPRRDNTGIVRERAFYGGYVQGQYRWQYSDVGVADFYVRWQEYRGGLKFETGAPDVKSHAVELGVAWSPFPQWELTSSLEFVSRKNYERMTGFATGTCNSTVPISTQPPLTNVNCVPQPQFNANATLIRFQLQWFWN